MIVNGLEVLSRAVTDAAIRGDKYRIRQVTEAIKEPEFQRKLKATGVGFLTIDGMHFRVSVIKEKV